MQQLLKPTLQETSISALVGPAEEHGHPWWVARLLGGAGHYTEHTATDGLGAGLWYTSAWREEAGGGTKHRRKRRLSSTDIPNGVRGVLRAIVTGHGAGDVSSAEHN